MAERNVKAAAGPLELQAIPITNILAMLFFKEGPVQMETSRNRVPAPVNRKIKGRIRAPAKIGFLENLRRGRERDGAAAAAAGRQIARCKIAGQSIHLAERASALICWRSSILFVLYNRRAQKKKSKGNRMVTSQDWELNLRRNTPNAHGSAPTAGFGIGC